MPSAAPHPQQVVAEHFKTTGDPVGHGFTAENKAKGTAYYTFDKGRVRCIVLDSVNPNGYDDGSLDTEADDVADEACWRHRTDKYVLVFSHHTSGTMDNPLIATGLDLAASCPRARPSSTCCSRIPMSSPGSTATPTRTRSGRTQGRDGTSGFWEINTASHIDFPQQSRLIELVDNNDGTLSIFTTMVDHAGPAAYGGVVNNPVALAGLARSSR